MADAEMRYQAGPTNGRSNRNLPPPKCALLWSPIPILTWLLPPLGHMGVSDSRGTCYDFAGPYTICEDPDGWTIFGPPRRYMTVEFKDLSLAPAVSASGTLQGMTAKEELERWWNHNLVQLANSYRQHQMYNIFTTNCHYFVAAFLSTLGYKGCRSWNMVHLATLVFIWGHYTGWMGVLATWLPWCIIVGLGSYFGRLIFLYAYLGLCVPLLTWFLLYTGLTAWRTRRQDNLEKL